MSRTFFSFLEKKFHLIRELVIFSYMDETENKFLQKVDLDALQKETGMDLKELASLAGIGPNVIYKWAYMHKDSSRPDYNAIVRLIERGATVETLFGVAYRKADPIQESDDKRIDTRSIIREEVVQIISDIRANGEL